MCIICTRDYTTDITTLNCSGCSTITKIPDTLTNLNYLFCDRCPKLTSIPSTLVNLTNLYFADTLKGGKIY